MKCALKSSPSNPEPNFAEQVRRAISSCLWGAVVWKSPIQICTFVKVEQQISRTEITFGNWTKFKEWKFQITKP